MSNPPSLGSRFAFDGPRLHAAILARERTIPAFAEEAGVSASVVYRALRGEHVILTSALRIERALRRLPLNTGLEGLAAGPSPRTGGASP
jgi:hypothetical protein